MVKLGEILKIKGKKKIDSAFEYLIVTDIGMFDVWGILVTEYGVCGHVTTYSNDELYPVDIITIESLIEEITTANLVRLNNIKTTLINQIGQAKR